MAKPLLLQVYMSNAGDDHRYPLHIQMWLVPEIDTILNTQGWKKVEKLWACQLTWHSSKLMTYSHMEIELLDNVNTLMGISLWDAMMWIQHPANPKFTLFHSINCHWKIIVMFWQFWNWAIHLPMLWLQQCYHTWCGPTKYNLDGWQSPKSPNSLNQMHGHKQPMLIGICTRIACAIEQWHPCPCNSQLQCTLLWGRHRWAQPPKQKCIQVDHKLMLDLVSTVKTAVSSIKIYKSSMKKMATPLQATQSTPNNRPATDDSQTITSQMITISQLTKQMLVLQSLKCRLIQKLTKNLAKCSPLWSRTPIYPHLPNAKASGLSRDTGQQSWQPCAQPMLLVHKHAWECAIM